MMQYNLAAVREMLMAAFSDEEFQTFCFDHFPRVHEQFTLGQIQGARVRLLVDYADRQLEIDRLIEKVRHINPRQYDMFKSQLSLLHSLELPHTTTSELVHPLPVPLQKYDAFFTQFSHEMGRWNGDAQTYANCVLSALATAMPADYAFLVSNQSGTWTVIGAQDDRAFRELQTRMRDSLLREILSQASRRSEASLVPETSANSGILLVPFGASHPIRMLVLYGTRHTAQFDSLIGTAIQSLLQQTNGLSRPVAPELVEMEMYSELRRQSGYVSDIVYNRQFLLFGRRLEHMTIRFEPIIFLHPKQPYVAGWEALARDPDSSNDRNSWRAPAYLFEIAELWGRRFQLELDMHFLEKAIDTYVKALQQLESGRLRKGEIVPLSVNVYPESLIRTAYRNKLRSLHKAGIMPMNKVTLEISEKSPLPSIDEATRIADPTLWFREKLRLLEEYDVSFAIDDFGVGHASSSRLSRLLPSQVKIDRDALLDKFGDHTFDYVLTLARNVGGKMQVVIEGLDHDSRFSLRELYSRGIRYVQGHSLGKPRDNVDRLNAQEVEHIRLLLGNIASAEP